MSEWIDVCAEGELAPGDFRTVWVDDVEVAIINCGGKFYALEDVCTHDGGELTGGVIEGCEIECPRHGARFDIRTGQVLAPPAYEPIRTYPVEVRSGRIVLGKEAAED